MATAVTYIPETQFAHWMAAWADRVSATPGWRELTHYRGVSALDCGYSHLYFRVLDQVRPLLDPDACMYGSDLTAAASPGTGRLQRMRRRVRDGVTVVGGMRLVRERLAFRWRMMQPPRDVPFCGPGRAALVVTASPNATAFPVLEALRDECGWRLQIASWSRAAERSARAINLPYLHLAETYRRRYLSFRQKHRADIESEMELLSATELTSMFSELAGKPVAADLASLVRQVCLEVRVQTDLYTDLLSRAAPAALILFSESTIRERPAARVAALMGIKTVTIMHGLFIGHVYRSLATDRMVVWGPIPRDFTLARGCAAEAVISAGGFGHERWLIDQPAAAGEPSVAAQPTVLFLGQNPAAFISPRLYQGSIDIVWQAARRLPHVRFVVRPHPSESPVPYERAARSNPVANLTLGGGGDLQALLRSVDVVLTVFSTAGVEAMLVGTPVVVLNPVPEPSLAPYAGAASVAQSGGSLADAVRRLIEDAAHRVQAIRMGQAYAQEYFGPIEGASRRAARAMDAFLAETPSESMVHAAARTGA